MKYRFESLKQILDLFQEESILGATEISEKLGLSRTIVHKYLKELVLKKELKKIGQGPKTKYKSEKIFFDNKDDNNKIIENNYLPNFKTRKILDEIFYKFTADGNILKGFSGLVDWCNFRGLDIKEKVKNYLSIYKHIEDIQNKYGLLNAKDVFGKHFEKVYLDNVYYADQYKWMEFGRGKLAEMTFFAKQSQNKELINESINKISFQHFSKCCFFILYLKF